MLPFLLATDIHLIAFNSTLKSISIALLIEQANLLKHIPCGGLCHINITTQLIAADTFLVRGYEIHCHEPLDKWQLGVLEDCANQAREVPATALAAKLSVPANDTVMATTVRADYIVIAPSLFDDGLLTLLVRSEI